MHFIKRFILPVLVIFIVATPIIAEELGTEVL